MQRALQIVSTLVLACGGPPAPSPATPSPPPASAERTSAPPSPPARPRRVPSPTAAVRVGPPGPSGLTTAIWAPLRRLAAADSIELYLHWTRPDRRWLSSDDPLGQAVVDWGASASTFVVSFDSASGQRRARITRTGAGLPALSLRDYPSVRLKLTSTAVQFRLGGSAGVFTRIADAEVTPIVGEPTAIAVSGTLLSTDGSRLVRFRSPAVTIVRDPSSRPLSELEPIAKSHAQKVHGESPDRDPRQPRNIRLHAIAVDRDDGTRIISFAGVSGRIWTRRVIQVAIRPDGTITGQQQSDESTCIGRGSPIATAAGAVPVESLRVGQRVRAIDPATGRLTRPRVQSITPHGRRPTRRLGRGWVTDEHPVLKDGAFVRADSLRIGDVVMTERGEAPLGASGPVLGTGDVRTVYDISVEWPHTFFAGGVLVHNKTVAAGPWLHDPWWFAPRPVK